MANSGPAALIGPVGPQRSWWAGRFAALMALLWVFAGLAMVPHYGLAIDAPGLFYGGERTLYWLHHGLRPEALDLRAPEPRDFRTSYGRWPSSDDPLHYPVFPDLVAASVARLVAAVGLPYPDWEAHELGLLLLHAAGLFFFCRYAVRLVGPLAGVAASLALAGHPTVIGSALNNPKDWPAALFYGVGLLVTGVALLEDRPRQLMVAGVFFGLSLSAKLNGVFGVLTAALWLPIAWGLLHPRRWPTRTHWLSAAALPLVAFGVFVLLWPWLYSQGLSHLFVNLGDYVSFLAAYGVGPRPTWSTYSLRCVIGYTPPLCLLLAAWGLIQGWRGGGPALASWALLSLWLAVPLVRIAAPHSNFYDGNRHFLEYIPALALCGGVGFAALLRALGERWPTLRGAAFAAVGLLGLLDLAVPIARYHPYEIAYFSPLIGGLGGAQARRWLFEPPPHEEGTERVEGDYWFSATADMVRELRGLRKPGQRVGLCGPYWWQVTLASQPNEPPPLAELEHADLVLEEYRGCGQHPELASLRPVLREVRRGGGLIYRILGPATSTRRENPVP